MSNITDKQNCCGCSACAQRCPKQSIAMVQDEEGFLYPQVDVSTCIDCGLCEKICPMFTSMHTHEPQGVFAAKNQDENVRKESSSGGIFTMLAENTIHEGGVVFGACWSRDWNVEHSYTETIEGLKAFRSSKYVQSNIGNCFLKTETFLKEGRKVLFSGTPCQIAGLKAYLRCEYDNLLTIECACHGVPSPGLWQKYLAEVSKGKEITNISHRDKRTGWRNYSIVIKFADGREIVQPHDDNPWLRAFIKNINLRPSCHQCAFKLFKSQADITLADLWGDQKLLPDQNDDKGITLVIVRSGKGEKVITNIERLKDFTLENVVPFNEALVNSPQGHIRRTDFFSRMQQGDSFVKTVKSYTKNPLILRIKLFIRKYI